MRDGKRRGKSRDESTVLENREDREEEEKEEEEEEEEEEEDRDEDGATQSGWI